MMFPGLVSCSIILDLIQGSEYSQGVISVRCCQGTTSLATSRAFCSSLHCLALAVSCMLSFTLGAHVPLSTVTLTSPREVRIHALVQ